jgi:hypothetical protein
VSGNFVYVKIVVCGDSHSREEFKARHLKGGQLDLNTVIPMPVELDIDHDNLLQTGYDALYGDWRNVAKQWMLKESADEFGYPFPLESREEVLTCLRSLDGADNYLVPAQRYKRNLERFGHGTAITWREANWGTRSKLDGVKIRETDDAVVIRFVCDAYSGKAIVELSRLWPALEFKVAHVDEYKRQARSLVVKSGREGRKVKESPVELMRNIEDFVA